MYGVIEKILRVSYNILEVLAQESQAWVKLELSGTVYISNIYVHVENLTFYIHVHVKYICTNSCTHKDMNVYM